MPGKTPRVPATSSDILEDQFGATRLRIHEQRDGFRIISTEARDGSILELSLVTFGGPGAQSFPGTHGKVLSGRSMGKAFREDGIAFYRETRGVYVCEPPGAFGRRFGRPGLATVVEVSVLVGPRKLPYADILEVYSPGVAWPVKASAADGRIMAELGRFDELLTDIT